VPQHRIFKNRQELFVVEFRTKRIEWVARIGLVGKFEGAEQQSKSDWRKRSSVKMAFT